MTTESLTTPVQTPSATRRGSIQRVAALARGEALLLRRNPLAVITALVLPAALVFLSQTAVPAAVHESVGETTVISLTVATLALVVYYNLVTALVARREEQVLKRLRTGEASDAEILAGTAMPAVGVAWGQILIGLVAAIIGFGLALPVNPVLAIAAVGLGTAVFLLLAAVSTALTRTVQLAELTTTPVLVTSLAFSGWMFPLDQLPEPVQRIAEVLPLTQVVELLRLGLTGTIGDGATVDFIGSFGAAAVPVLILLAWLAAGAWATRRWFRWEARR